MKPLGDRILALKEDEQATYEGLASRAGVSQYSIYMWSQGRTFPAVENYDKLTNLGVTIDTSHLEDVASSLLMTPAELIKHTTSVQSVAFRKIQIEDLYEIDRYLWEHQNIGIYTILELVSSWYIVDAVYQTLERAKYYWGRDRLYYQVLPERWLVQLPAGAVKEGDRIDNLDRYRYHVHRHADSRG